MRLSWLVWIVIAFVVLIVLPQTFFTIDERDQAIILQFGKYMRTIAEPGLNWKIPFLQRVIRFDKRVLTSDASAVEYITVDKKRVVVDHVSRWRISDPLEFFRTVRTEAGALVRLDDIIVARLRQEIAKHAFIDFIREQRESIMETVTTESRELASRFGIEILDVRIKRVDLPDEVQASVFARMRAERQRIATRYRAEGEEKGREIRAAADKEKEIILATAYEASQTLRGEGDARATQIYAESFERDPEFYAFLRHLETYERTLGEKTMLVLPEDSHLLNYLTAPGQPGGRR